MGPHHDPHGTPYNKSAVQEHEPVQGLSFVVSSDLFLVASSQAQQVFLVGSPSLVVARSSSQAP